MSSTQPAADFCAKSGNTCIANVPGQRQLCEILHPAFKTSNFLINALTYLVPVTQFSQKLNYWNSTLFTSLYAYLHSEGTCSLKILWNMDWKTTSYYKSKWKMSSGNHPVTNAQMQWELRHFIFACDFNMIFIFSELTCITFIKAVIFNLE